MRGYYAILDAGGGDLVRRAEELLAAGPCCLQLRAKDMSAREMREAAARLLPMCRSAGVPFCVNDRVDVALAVGADAVHVGQDDLPLAETRALVRARMLIGVSTHDQAQAVAAAEGGADYIGFGPIFATSTKMNPDPVIGLSGLTAVARRVSKPIVAIGGIELEQVPAVAAAGASAAAVISAVDRAPDRTGAGRRIAAAFAGLALAVLATGGCADKLNDSSRSADDDPIPDGGMSKMRCPDEPPKVGDICPVDLLEDCTFAVGECITPSGHKYVDYLFYCCRDGWQICGGMSACDEGDAGRRTEEPPPDAAADRPRDAGSDTVPDSPAGN
jgi:thiamine-phosphate pyrophosphorylase